MAPRTDDTLGRLLQAARLAVPDDLPGLIRHYAAELGAADATLFLVDHDQRVLVAVPDVKQVNDTELVIDATLAGRCFRLVEPQETVTDDGRQLWLPVVDGIERLGVLQLTFRGDAGKGQDSTVHALAALIAELVLSKTAYGDLFHQLRRRESMTLAAEIAWNLLPPLTFGTEDVTISAVLAPAYSVGGDAFDYGVDHSTARFAIFDAMGHGLEAGLLATVAIGAYRNSRRRADDMASTLLAIDDAIATTFGPERFVTGVLGELDLGSGRVQWSLSGHPAPLLLRRGRVVKALDADVGLPFGLGSVGPVAEEWLEPGDSVLLFSDGVVDARSPEGEFFGVTKLADYVAREAAAQHAVPETMRRLMHALLDHPKSELQDDATTVLVEWRGGSAQRIVN